MHDSRRAIVLSCLLLLATSISQAAPSTLMEIICLPESFIKIDGDSTARKYSAVATPIALKGKASAGQGLGGQLPWTPVELDLTLAVADLKSGERTLDRHLHENLKAEKHPTIQVKLTAFAGTNPLQATGSLTAAGVTQPIVLQPAVTIEGKNVRIKGKHRLVMSAFGIEPPTMMMGTLKTRDEIDVSYDVVCSIAEKQKAGK